MGRTGIEDMKRLRRGSEVMEKNRKRGKVEQGIRIGTKENVK